MHPKTRDAIAAKIAVIKANPLAWAQAAEEAILKTTGSAARHAKRLGEDELRQNAAEELAKAEALLASATAKPAEPADMARLERANERTHKAIENLES